MPSNANGSWLSSPAMNARAASAVSNPRRARIAPTTGETPSSRATESASAYEYGLALQRESGNDTRDRVGAGADRTGEDSPNRLSSRRPRGRRQRAESAPLRRAARLVPGGDPTSTRSRSRRETREPRS